jgi:formylglycine-generating enzyme required for sulfatase activity
LLGIIILFLGCSNEKAPEIEGMVYIPSGKFIMGSNEIDNNDLAKEFGAKHVVFFANEKPERKINLKDFYIEKYEVANKDYGVFIEKTKYTPPLHWINGAFEAGKETHPVFNVSWFDASAYCKWAGKRLPTEEEWEKAARGPKGNKYPWGNDFDNKKGNLTKGHTMPVGGMAEDKSFYGIYDMGGNVMEWTASWYKPYPGSTFQSKEFGEKTRVIKGGYGSVKGHYNLGNLYSRPSFRNFFPPKGKGNDVGFRCAKDR